MVTVGDKVRKAREGQVPPWSQYDLAEKLNFGRGKIAMWESGKTLHPKQVDIQKTADLFGIPVEWFYDGKPGDPPKPEPEPSNATVVSDPKLIEGFAMTVAVRTWGTANAALIADEECTFVELDVPHEIPAGFLIGGARNLEKHDLLIVGGRSMSPRIEPGDRVLFFQDQTPRRNTIVFAQDPEGRVLIKALRDVANKWQLHSIATDGAKIEDTTGWKICGYAIAILGDEPGGRNIEWPFGQPIKV